jgi:flagellar basal-body rod protein FlgB
MSFFNNTNLRHLELSLDATALRQQTISNNIANADTPNFKLSSVEFEKQLEQALQASRSTLTGNLTHQKHIPIGSFKNHLQPKIVEDSKELMYNNNRNNVDIDFEMSLMAQNQLRYNMLIEQMNHEIKKLRTAIGGR